MHEVAIAEGIFNIIEKEKQQHNFNTVTSIELVCGKYNCVSEEHLAFCFDLITKETYIDGAKLTVTRVPELCTCMDCTKEFEKEDALVLVCPFCSSGKIQEKANYEIYLKSLEVE